MLLEDATNQTRIYIAGPMTGYPYYNYKSFHDVESQLNAAGYQYINNPARHFHGNQELPWETYIAKAIDVIMNSEAVVVLPGWYKSVGARLEIAIATAIGNVVYSAIKETEDTYSYVLRSIGESRDLVAALMKMGDHPLIPSTDNTETKQQKSQPAYEEAEGIVHGDRQAAYGHPLDNYSRLSTVWTALLDDKLKPTQTISAEDCTMMLAAMKLVRQMHTPKRDNIVDTHGYLMVHDMIGKERDRRGQIA